MKPFRGNRQINKTHPFSRGMVGCWLFNEGVGDRVFDSSGNGNNGTMSNMSQSSWVSDKTGFALNFDAADDKIDCGSGSVLDDLFVGGGTVAAWVNLAGAGEGGAGRIIDKQSGGGGYLITAYDVSGGYLRPLVQQIFATTNGQWQTTARVLAVNTYSMVAVTYDTTGDPVIYIDGVSMAVSETSTPAGAVTTDAGAPLVIGNNNATTATLDGKISQIYTWNRILSATEISRIYFNPFVMFD